MEACSAAQECKGVPGYPLGCCASKVALGAAASTTPAAAAPSTTPTPLAALTAALDVARSHLATLLPPDSHAYDLDHMLGAADTAVRACQKGTRPAPYYARLMALKAMPSTVGSIKKYLERAVCAHAAWAAKGALEEAVGRLEGAIRKRFTDAPPTAMRALAVGKLLAATSSGGTGGGGAGDPKEDR